MMYTAGLTMTQFIIILTLACYIKIRHFETFLLLSHEIGFDIQLLFSGNIITNRLLNSHRMSRLKVKNF